MSSLSKSTSPATVVAKLACRRNHYWARAPSFDGGEGDAADTRTDTTVPDDDDDVASSSDQETATSDMQDL